MWIEQKCITDAICFVDKKLLLRFFALLLLQRIILLFYFYSVSMYVIAASGTVALLNKI